MQLGFNLQTPQSLVLAQYGMLPSSRIKPELFSSLPPGQTNTFCSASKLNSARVNMTYGTPSSRRHGRWRTCQSRRHRKERAPPDHLRGPPVPVRIASSFPHGIVRPPLRAGSSARPDRGVNFCGYDASFVTGSVNAAIASASRPL